MKMVHQLSEILLFIYFNGSTPFTYKCRHVSMQGAVTIVMVTTGSILNNQLSWLGNQWLEKDTRESKNSFIKYRKYKNKQIIESKMQNF